MYIAKMEVQKETLFHSDDGNSYSMNFDILVCRFVVPYSEWFVNCPEETRKMKFVTLKKEQTSYNIGDDIAKISEIAVFVGDKRVAYVAGQHMDVAKVYMIKAHMSYVSDVGTGSDPKYAIITLKTCPLVWELDPRYRKNLAPGYKESS